jgi:hypothetical protein
MSTDERRVASENSGATEVVLSLYASVLGPVEVVSEHSRRQPG